MRANGVPDYPYPTGDTTDFMGTGVDPDSPSVERVSQLCGKKIGAPAWWINGTDTPGSIEVHTAGTNPSATPPACFYQKVDPCSGTVTKPAGDGGSAATPGRAPMAEFSARQVVVIAALAGALVGGAVAGAVAVVSASGNPDRPASSSGGSGSVSTAQVVRTNLTNTVQVGGSIGYGGFYAIAALRGAGGVYTWLPGPGQVIKQDQPVYSISNDPVPLLYGSVAAYRAVRCRHVRRPRRGRADPRPDRPRLRRRAAPEQPLLPGHRRRRSNAGRARSACRRPARSCSARWSSSPAPSGSRRSRRRSATPVGAGGRHRADGHEHHSHRHRRPGRQRGVPGQARRRGVGRAARRHLHGERADRDGRHRGHLPGRRRHRRRRQAAAARPTSPCSSNGSGTSPPRR
jgi:hypothetical protein